NNPWFLLLFFSYGIATFGLFLYSFFQIDLNLTLINHPVYLEFQKPFIEFGYYNRQEAVRAYMWLLLVSFILYIGALLLISLKKLTIFHLGILVISICAMLFF